MRCSAPLNDERRTKDELGPLTRGRWRLLDQARHARSNGPEPIARLECIAGLSPGTILLSQAGRKDDKPESAHLKATEIHLYAY